MKIIKINNKKGYPSRFVTLCRRNGKFYLGGRNCPIVVVKDSKEAQKLMYHVKKQMKEYDIEYYTHKLEGERE